jgi:6-phospho-3-hexuloisomerase
MRSDPDRVKKAGQDLLGRIESVMAKADWHGLLDLADMLPRAPRTFVTGAGRSGLVARSFGMRLMHVGLRAHIPGETTTPAAAKDDLIVAVSTTGTTGYTAYLAQRAKELGATVVAITSEAESPLAKLADKVIIIPAEGDDIVIRAAVFEHAVSLCLDAVFNVLAEFLKVDVEEFQRHHANLE